MYWLKLFLEIVIGIAAGSFTAAGLFAVINVVIFFHIISFHQLNDLLCILTYIFLYFN